MNVTKYILEIYHAKDTSVVLASFESTTPFSPIHIGDLIDWITWEKESDLRENVRVTEVKHMIMSSGTSLIHHVWVCGKDEPARK